VDTEQVVAELNVALGTEYELVRWLTGGLQGGAFELTDGTTRVVLKWSADASWAPRVHRAARLVAKARAAGYPTPAWLAAGTTAGGSPYQLQDETKAGLVASPPSGFRRSTRAADVSCSSWKVLEQA
jgi:hypothetical protein